MYPPDGHRPGLGSAQKAPLSRTDDHRPNLERPDTRRAAPERHDTRREDPERTDRTTSKPYLLQGAATRAQRTPAEAQTADQDSIAQTRATAQALLCPAYPQRHHIKSSYTTFQ